MQETIVFFAGIAIGIMLMAAVVRYAPRVQAWLESKHGIALPKRPVMKVLPFDRGVRDRGGRS
jgi:hypothetical protein